MLPFAGSLSTTIVRRIYLPFTPGEGANLWSQIVTCVHEHEHVDVRELDPNPADGLSDEEAAKGGVLFRGNPKLELAALSFDDSPHPLYDKPSQ